MPNIDDTENLNRTSIYQRKQMKSMNYSHNAKHGQVMCFQNNKPFFGPCMTHVMSSVCNNNCVKRDKISTENRILRKN
jgi:hypothetical protein